MKFSQSSEIYSSIQKFVNYRQSLHYPNSLGARCVRGHLQTDFGTLNVIITLRGRGFSP